MKIIKLKSIHIQNFKGCVNKLISFGELTKIYGAMGRVRSSCRSRECIGRLYRTL